MERRTRWSLRPITPRRRHNRSFKKPPTDINAQKDKTNLDERSRGQKGPPYIEQEDIHTKVEKLTGTTHTNLPEDFKARQDCHHFPEKHTSLCLNAQKVTSRNVAHIINQPELKSYLREKRGMEREHMERYFTTIIQNRFQQNTNSKTTNNSQNYIQLLAHKQTSKMGQRQTDAMLPLLE
jgi:hypothetical protein